jgi:hypothetical protein
MIISFDFDGTLDDEFGGIPNPQKYEIQKIAKNYVSDPDNRVMIITKRYDMNNSHRGLKNEHVRVFELAKELGITEVHFTNREMKFSTIIRLNVNMHFENSKYEVDLINQSCKEHNHNCIVVPVEEPHWRDLVY